MLQYLIILLDETSTSFCHYECPNDKRKLISLAVLQQGIRFGMMENLMIQFVYPNYDLPAEYNEVIENIDHSKIKPIKEGADIWVTDQIKNVQSDIPVVWRTKKDMLWASEDDIIATLENVPRLNIVLTDIHFFTNEDFEKYELMLKRLSERIEKMYVEGKTPQLNLLTDRMMLNKMNNCGAGFSSLTLAPNGKFYICPAFFYEDENDSVGDLENGLDIKNKQLYQLSYAPICRNCDAYQCKRCIWLNRKTTREVNTPSHEQCVIAHIERNTSRNLLNSIRKHITFLPEMEEIKDIDYWDPFNIVNRWK
ncbi:MAG: CXXX repeat peptide maturase [Bacteroidaceae bacterium]|nr:CXXX repeat peptide maturase [Bacteroidaceae bacterium]